MYWGQSAGKQWGHWQPAGSLARDGWNPKASWASACHAHPWHRASSPAGNKRHAHTTGHTKDGDASSTHPLTEGSLGSIFTYPRFQAQHPTLWAGTHSLSCQKQAGVTLAARRKGLLGCSFLQQPMHTALGCSPSHEGLTQCTKGLYRSDMKLKQTHNQEKLKISEKTKAGKCVTVPLLFLSRPMFCMKPGVTHVRNLR